MSGEAQVAELAKAEEAVKTAEEESRIRLEDPATLTQETLYKWLDSNPSEREVGIPHQKSMWNTEIIYGQPAIEKFINRLEYMADSRKLDISRYSIEQLDAIYMEELKSYAGEVLSAGVGLVSGAGSFGYVKTNHVQVPVEAASKVVTPEGFTRVGRWMSPAEAKAMQSSGKVQLSGGNMTHVTSPADAAAFKAASPGSVFVEFDVPSGAMVTGGKPGWSIIPGPGSIYDRFSLTKGGTGYQQPSALNITIAGSN